MAKRLMLTLMALVLGVGLCAPIRAGAAPQSDEDDRKPDRYILPGDAVFPEGIAFQDSTGNFYVSSTTDGTILRGHFKDERAEVFLPGGADGRTTATGLKVDQKGRLFVSGAGTGKVFVYDTKTKQLLASFADNASPTFVNDVAVARDGAAYFTDSLSPFLYKVSANKSGQFSFERWLDFTGSPLVYQTGFNVNGIVATGNGKYLIVVQSNTGKLFRITIATKKVVEIDLGSATVTNGDGLLLRGTALYVVRNALGLIAKVRLSDNYTEGRVVSETTDPSFAFPTTIAEARGRLLVVNSQFNRRGPPPTPVLPFTVSSVRIP
jgi:Cu-Zn family superoxide dismutase